MKQMRLQYTILRISESYGVRQGFLRTATSSSGASLVLLPSSCTVLLQIIESQAHRSQPNDWAVPPQLILMR